VDIRAARADDAAAIAAIWNQGIEERVATFDTSLREAADIEPLTSGGLPFLVAEEDGAVVGWAKLSEYSDRCVYGGVAEISVYVDRHSRGRSVGRSLVEAVCAEAERAGLWKVVALLFPENAVSMALFDRAGFGRVGTFTRHGRLDGEWRDVVILEHLLGPAAT
jgi:phosphinothricin acetyltransferase